MTAGHRHPGRWPGQPPQASGEAGARPAQNAATASAASTPDASAARRRAAATGERPAGKWACRSPAG